MRRHTRRARAPSRLMRVAVVESSFSFSSPLAQRDDYPEYRNTGIPGADYRLPRYLNRNRKFYSSRTAGEDYRVELS